MIGHPGEVGYTRVSWMDHMRMRDDQRPAGCECMDDAHNPDNDDCPLYECLECGHEARCHSEWHCDAEGEPCPCRMRRTGRGYRLTKGEEKR